LQRKLALKAHGKASKPGSWQNYLSLPEAHFRRKAAGGSLAFLLKNREK
jgi:hypothetical protein